MVIHLAELKGVELAFKAVKSRTLVERTSA